MPSSRVADRTGAVDWSSVSNEDDPKPGHIDAAVQPRQLDPTAAAAAEHGGTLL
jgi:hypothetical protein